MYKTSLYPNSKEKSVYSEELIKIIKDSADLLNQSAGLIIGIITAFGIVLTLFFQYRENKKQNFRTNFFEYLRIHRENVQQIETRGKKGHDAFIEIFKELKYVYDNFPISTDAYKIYRLEWSYVFVFFGLGETATPIVRDYLLKKYPRYTFEVEHVIRVLTKLQLTFQEARRKKQIKVLGYTLNIKNTVRDSPLKCILDGHQSDLGHYYRHLYQMINFIKDFPTLFSFEKYDYIKNVRAQFSNHEIALFMINGYSPLGDLWIRENLIVEYQLIKNLPYTLLIPFGKDIKGDFPSIDFEI